MADINNPPSAPESPVPRRALMLELARSAFLLVGLVGAALLFFIAGAWVIGIIITIVAVLGAVSGAVVHPKQLATAMHPKSVSHASATPVARHKQAWLMLGDDSGRELAVELRARRLALSIGSQTIPVTVAGPLEPGSWIIVQTLGMTLWPASKVLEGMPKGASYDLRGARASWRDLSGPRD